MSKKKIANEAFEKHEKAILWKYETGELTRERARELLVEFYKEYERESEDV